MTWDKAKSHCESIGSGSTLAIVDSDSTRDAIAAVADTGTIWIGLKERADKKSWETVYGDTNTYNGWEKEQPEPQKTGADEESSAVMMWDAGYGRNKWHDFPPNSSFFSVCQTSELMNFNFHFCNFFI